jgi:signal transduction histidine kinase
MIFQPHDFLNINGIKKHGRFFIPPSQIPLGLSGRVSISLPMFIFSLALVIVIGYIDYVTDPYLSFLIFYLVPIFLATWFVTCWTGYFMLFASLIMWVFDDFHSSGSYSHPIVPYWDLILKFVFCYVAIRGICFIKELLRRIQTQNKELDRLNQLKSQFVANVSHEVKSPLAIVRESLSIVLDGEVGEINAEQKEILQVGKAAIDRLLRLVSDLLDLSKIEAGKMELKREEIDFGRVVEEVLVAYGQELSLKQITVTKNIHKDLGFVWGDKDKLTQVVINLLTNAIKYMGGSGSIAITVKGTQEEIRFEISDTGPGIAKENFKKIFDKFERIAFAGKQDGAGLGLPIAKDIIELHRGKIWVESELGKGSTFIFTFPRDFRA